VALSMRLTARRCRRWALSHPQAQAAAYRDLANELEETAAALEDTIRSEGRR
jgi:hypothetical protein